METKLSALFENPDMADFALRRLRESNIQVRSFHIRPAGYSPEGEKEEGRFDAFPAPAPVNSAAMGMGYMGIPGMVVGPVFTGENRWLANRPADTNGGEVILLAVVPNEEIARARGVLVNARGRQIRQY